MNIGQGRSGGALGTWSTWLGLGVGLAVVLALGVGGTLVEHRWADEQMRAQQAQLSNATAAVASEVSIREDSYSPSSIEVSAGTTVTWRNDGTSPHQVTFHDAALVGSDLFGRGQTFAYRFERPGSYTYYCQLHPFMVGGVVVK